MILIKIDNWSGRFSPYFGEEYSYDGFIQLYKNKTYCGLYIVNAGIIYWDHVNNIIRNKNIQITISMQDKIQDQFTRLIKLQAFQ